MTNAIPIDGTSIINNRYDNSSLAGAGLLLYYNGFKFLDEGVDFTVNSSGGFTLIGVFAGGSYTSSEKFIIIPNWTSNSSVISNSANAVYYNPTNSNIPRIAQIILWAKVCQALAERDISICKAKGINHPNEQMPEILYEVRTSIEWKYSQNQDDISLYNTSEYLYSLCGKYLALAMKLTSNTTNTSTPPPTTFQIQWDYVLMSVNTVPNSSTLDGLTLSNTAGASVGSALTITIPSAPSFAYKLVIRYPLTESTKTSWYNTANNNGAMPYDVNPAVGGDSVFYAVIVGSNFKYIVSRVNGLGLDNTSPTIFS